jgi:hypothetical protein
LANFLTGHPSFLRESKQRDIEEGWRGTRVSSRPGKIGRFPWKGWLNVFFEEGEDAGNIYFMEVGNFR